MTDAISTFPQTSNASLAGGAAPASSNSALTSDFETFLQMLTAQAKYQDPLEPLDSSEYASQLAQFSGVEQQVQTNDLLTAMRDQLGTSNMAQFAGWIGLEARTTGYVQFENTPIEMTPEPAAVASEAQLVVYNTAGSEVQRLAIPTEKAETSWVGVDSDGVPLPAGQYRFEVESFANDQLIATSPVSTYARVNETRVENGHSILVLQGGVTVQSAEVTALRSPA